MYGDKVVLSDYINNKMVYIKLAESLYQRIKQHILPDKLVTCNKQFYISYPEFKRIAHQYSIPLHREIGRQDIITYTQMDQLIEQEKQTPQQRRLIEELKNKRELRLLGKINPNKNPEDYYFQNKKQSKGMKEMTETISFSMAFIFTFFMAGVTGYYVGAFFLNWTLAQSLMLSLAFIIVTLIVQTSLFILKQSKKQPKVSQRTYRKEYDSGIENAKNVGLDQKKKKQ